MRIYDPRLGRFLSVDPLCREYPWNSVYAYAENNVVRCVDLDGLERYYYWRFKDKQGKTYLAVDRGDDLIEEVGTGEFFQYGDEYKTFYREITRTAKNERQEYVVLQEDEYTWYDANGKYQELEYNESVTFHSYNAAVNSIDRNFEGTTDDIKWGAVKALLQP